MQGNKSVIKLNSGGPVEVNSTMRRGIDKKTGVFIVERIITYSYGKRKFSLNITEVCKNDIVNIVYLEGSEETESGSSATLSMRIIRSDRYGVLCNMTSKLVGSYDMVKKNYSVPPLPESELVCYFCRQNGSGGCFSIEKKKSNNNFVEMVKATHAFVVDEETINVKMKITNEGGVGLRVKVEGPVKLTKDYAKLVFGRIEEKMESEMGASTLSLFINAMDHLPPPNN
ncbi:uncharacterized protein LOC113852985 [Abrus precatorius]|uniref:Uncharacterized protein LOC113852985 n=1 Tax=Abrus precatorius TaxID=3816 RepID=A0A8B8K6B2_ABRPR|nr:uncharacterized protein LOC113852985 [Abrus precatorius]